MGLLDPRQAPIDLGQLRVLLDLRQGSVECRAVDLTLQIGEVASSWVVFGHRPSLRAGLSKLRGRRLHHRSRGVKDLAPISRARRVDALAIDKLLGPLRRLPGGDDATIPTFCIHRTPRAEIEDRGVPVYAQRQHRLAQQFAY